MRTSNRTSVPKPVAPTLSLFDLLKRRKTNLSSWSKETGNTTYAAVVNYCDRLGVISPTEEQFKICCPEVVTDQANGVIVFDVKNMQQPECYIAEPTEASQSDPCAESIEPPKKKRKTHQEVPGGTSRSDPEG
jgi:hypothetical protein